MSDPHPHLCLRSLDNVGPLLGAPSDTVLELHAPGRDHGGWTGEIRTVGRDFAGAGRTIGGLGAEGSSENRQIDHCSYGKEAICEKARQFFHLSAGRIRSGESWSSLTLADQ